MSVEALTDRLEHHSLPALYQLGSLLGLHHSLRHRHARLHRLHPDFSLYKRRQADSGDGCADPAEPAAERWVGESGGFVDVCWGVAVGWCRGGFRASDFDWGKVSRTLLSVEVIAREVWGAKRDRADESGRQRRRRICSTRSQPLVLRH